MINVFVLCFSATNFNFFLKAVLCSGDQSSGLIFSVFLTVGVKQLQFELIWVYTL